MAEKILIVDDDVETLRLVGIMLERQGYEISAAHNGERAIQKALDELPDLILLDVMMPKMSGYEVARELRSNESTKLIPIIMFTAKSQVDDKVEGLEAGADAYLTKPTQPRELLAQVKALLKRAPSAQQGIAASTQSRGFMIGILSAKGGLGVSSVAVNLGTTIFQLTKETVTVADFRPGNSDIGLGLGYNTPNGLSQLLKKDAISTTNIKRKLISHHSGIYLLMSPSRPRDAILINKLENFKTIAGHLPFISKYVLLDLGPALPPVTQSVLEYCDEFIIVVEPSPYNIRQTRTLVNDMYELGIGKGRIRAVVVNRIRSSLQMSWTDVKNELKNDVTTVITPAPDLAYKSRESGVPMVIQQPNSLTAEQFKKLAKALI
ncbi:MAG: response regulator [Chloroflexota bacterium]|nr:response regulator [Chloroflexota bacterium]